MQFFLKELHLVVESGSKTFSCGVGMMCDQVMLWHLSLAKYCKDLLISGILLHKDGDYGL